MCVPKTIEKVRDNLSRRGFVRCLGLATAGVTLGTSAKSAQAQTAPLGGQLRFNRIVDLTHPLGVEFPTYSGQRQLEIEQTTSTAVEGYSSNRWHLDEHTGTHLDAPIHFNRSGLSLDAIDVVNLAAPAVVVDIREKVADDPDAMVTVEDLENWEAYYGPIPVNAAVLMYSGWESRLSDPDSYRNTDDAGILHFPGFDPQAAEYLHEQREVIGIGVDTLSLDIGPSTDFLVHTLWLSSNRWGLENLANLGEIPAFGATIVVGVPKIAGASGGPARVLAFSI